MSKLDAVLAVKRFGFGAKPGELKLVGADGRGYVAAQLAAAKGVTLLAGPSLHGTEQLLRLEMEGRQQRKQLRQSEAAAAKAATAAKGTGAATTMSTGEAAAEGKAPASLELRDLKLGEIAARFERGATTGQAYLERLVVFWSNHFCVSAAKGRVHPIAGAFEREAIRPHVLGRFSDMLLAVTRHPAMLMYLDNMTSIGPKSQIGGKRGRGLNENLAREILELHTLGVDGGYTQADVTNLARIITGWTVEPLKPGQSVGGRFQFNDRMHEPGQWPLLDKSFGNNGVKAGEDALLFLAHHPSTARHVARKLARHFIGESAPQAVIDRLALTFRQTGGDLKELARTLATAPEAWEAPMGQILPPYDFLVSTLRGFNLTPPAGEIVRFANALGQPVWQPPSPKGWPDTNSAWLSSSGLNERLRIAERIAHFVDPDADPRDIAEQLLGPALSPATKQAIDFAEGREQGLHLLIMSPEFQRR